MKQNAESTIPLPVQDKSRTGTVLSEISEIREALVIGLLVGRLLSHILTLHVEEKGGQRRTQGYHSSSPSLMNGWRGGVEAEEK